MRSYLLLIPQLFAEKVTYGLNKINSTIMAAVQLEGWNFHLPENTSMCGYYQNSSLTDIDTSQFALVGTKICGSDIPQDQYMLVDKRMSLLDVACLKDTFYSSGCGGEDLVPLIILGAIILSISPVVGLAYAYQKNQSVRVCVDRLFCISRPNEEKANEYIQLTDKDTDQKSQNAGYPSRTEMMSARTAP